MELAIRFLFKLQKGFRIKEYMVCPEATCVFYYRVTSNSGTEMQEESSCIQREMSHSITHLNPLDRTRSIFHSGVFMMSKLDQMLSLLCILKWFMAYVSQLEKGRSFIFPWTFFRFKLPQRSTGLHENTQEEEMNYPKRGRVRHRTE